MSARLMAALVLLLASGAVGHAAAPGDKQAEAIRTFERGQAQFRDGRYDAAAALFKEAFETWEDPAYLYNVAFSFEKGERWRLAVHWYDRFLARYATSPNAPEVKLRREAALQSREAARATVFVVSEPAGARALALSDVDPGDEPPSCITPCLLKVDPGPVAIRVELGQVGRERSKSLAPTERWDLTLALPALERKVDRTPSWVAWGIGGASLLTGIILGVVAQTSFDKGQDLAARGPLDESGQRDLRAFREDVGDLSLYADIGFGGALVGATVGTILWFAAEPELHPVDQGAAW